MISLKPIRIIGLTLSCFFLSGWGIASAADTEGKATETPKETWAGGLPAFPGAEGFGAKASGGRSGKVLHVTTLEDYGRREKPIEGSLRWALTAVKGPRIVVFDVGGVVRLKSEIAVAAEYGDYTIAGQTAPGGVTLPKGFYPSLYRPGSWYKAKGRPQRETENFIVRHIRVRGYGRGADAIQMSKAANCILDHVSISGGGDELVDANKSTDYTFQWLTAEESNLGDQGKQSGSGGLDHNYGLFQGYSPHSKMNYHHLLIANHKRRCPYIHALYKSVTTQFDMRNCVLYNCGGGIWLQGPLNVNVINNNCLRGPDKGHGQVSGPRETGYYSGNFLHPLKGERAEISKPGRKEPWPWISVTTETPEKSLESVLNKAGAWPRDATTKRTIREVRTRTGRRGAHGPIELLAERRDGPTSEKHDRDRDGIPDSWEKDHGLDPGDPEDRNKIVPAGASPDDRHKGYTYVEYYLNELAESIVGKSLGPAYTIKTKVSPPDAGVINCKRAPRRNTSYNRPYIYGVIEWGEEEFHEGSTVVMRAKPRPGYVFSRWEGGPVEGLTAHRISFKAQSDVDITAHFEPMDPCTIGVSVSPPKTGNVAGKGAYREGDIVTLAAYSSKGHAFKRWVGGPLDKAKNPVIQFAASKNLEISAEFEPGNGGDLLIDHFNDQDKETLLKGASGKPTQWWSDRVSFAEISEGNYALTGSYHAFSLKEIQIPEGTTVFKFRVHNLDKEKEANVANRGKYAYTRRSTGLKWGKAKMWYSEPLRFPVLPAGKSAVMEIPLALLKNAEQTSVSKAGDKLKGFRFMSFCTRGLWNVKIAVDDVSFGRASEGPIKAPNLAPVANAGRDRIAGDMDGDGKERVYLNGYDSYDQNGGLIISWIWTENGKELAKGFAPAVELPVGKHVLTLTVKDEQGAIGTDTVTMVVRQ